MTVTGRGPYPTYSLQPDCCSQKLLGHASVWRWIPCAPTFVVFFAAHLDHFKEIERHFLPSFRAIWCYMGRSCKFCIVWIAGEYYEWSSSLVHRSMRPLQSWALEHFWCLKRSSFTSIFRFKHYPHPLAGKRLHSWGFSLDFRYWISSSEVQ